MLARMCLPLARSSIAIQIEMGAVSFRDPKLYKFIGYGCALIAYFLARCIL